MYFIHQSDYHRNSNQTAKINLSTAYIHFLSCHSRNLFFGNQQTDSFFFILSLEIVKESEQRNREKIERINELNLCVKHTMLIRIQNELFRLFHRTQFILWNYRFSDWKRALNGMLPLNECHSCVICQ